MRRTLSLLACAVLCTLSLPLLAADHNDPNAVNSIFSDVPVSAADLYDMFGWPADDMPHGDRVVLAMTFASVPRAGVPVTAMFSRLRVTVTPRVAGVTILTSLSNHLP